MSTTSLSRCCGIAVVAIGENQYELPVALTMWLVTVSVLHVVAAISTRDPERSMFGRYTISNMRFVMLILASLALTLLVTELTFLQRIFDTVSLTSRQWGVCLLATVIAVGVVEIVKLILRRTGWASTAPAVVETVEMQPKQRAGARSVPRAKDVAD